MKKYTKNTQSGMGELAFIIVVLILLFLIWAALGGRNRVNSDWGANRGPFLESPLSTYNPSPSPAFGY